MRYHAVIKLLQSHFVLGAAHGVQADEIPAAID